MGIATIAAEDELGMSGEVKVRDTRPKAVVLYCPATDLHIDHNVRLHGPIGNLMGKPEADIPAAYTEASPVDRIDDSHPATLLIHGDTDEVILLEHSVRYHEQLTASGVSSELVVLPGVGHGFGYGVKTQAQLDALRAVGPFLERAL